MTMVGEDADPLNVACDECGAQPGEPCRPWCTSRPEDVDAPVYKDAPDA